MDLDANLSIEHFRAIVDDQTKNLNSMCGRWSQVLEQYEDVSETEGVYDDETLGAIRTAIGQAKLLMSQRFKQFRELIDSCQHQTGQHPTRLSDLSGFWDMISIQVDDVETKFKNLEEGCRKN